MTSASTVSAAASIPQRSVALDAARGFVMLVLCTDGFGLGALDPLKHPVANLFRHFKMSQSSWCSGMPVIGSTSEKFSSRSDG